MLVLHNMADTLLVGGWLVMVLCSKVKHTQTWFEARLCNFEYKFKLWIIFFIFQRIYLTSSDL